MIIRTSAYARAGLIGNPSDGYFGKTMSIIVRNYRADAVIYESPELTIVPGREETFNFASMSSLVEDVRKHGYYGGVRLIKAAIMRFCEYCDEQGIHPADKNFTITYSSNIPRMVGMAGSSALVTATMRALMAFYEVAIPKPIQANLILSAEKDELAIGAGLQDRVCQVYEGAIYMDFEKSRMDRQGYGLYEELDTKALPPIYIAFDPERAESSDVFHGHIRTLYEEGNDDIVGAMAEFASLAEQARDLISAGKGMEISPLIDRNFDLRSEIYRISDENRGMVDTARAAGASAKFAGSGGAVIGVYEDEKMFADLARRMTAIGCVVFKPDI